MGTNRQLALLIDGDNINEVSLMPQVMAEIMKEGTIPIRRVYGDWSGSVKESWGKVLHLYGLSSIHQPNYTKGKNATDIALSIDAMDILYMENEVYDFCIASSDSDYTPLVTRLKRAGRFVMGIGEKKTPKPFVDACEKFVFIEDLQAPTDEEAQEFSQPIPPPLKVAEIPVKDTTMPKDLKKLLKKAFDKVGDNNGWASLSTVGQYLNSNQQFVARTTGPKRLWKLIKAYSNDFDCEERKSKKGNDVTYIRLKAGSNSAK